MIIETMKANKYEMTAAHDSLISVRLSAGGAATAAPNLDLTLTLTLNPLSLCQASARRSRCRRPRLPPGRCVPRPWRSSSAGRRTLRPFTLRRAPSFLNVLSAYAWNLPKASPVLHA